MWTWIGVAALVLLVLFVTNRRTVLALFGYGKAQVNKVGRAVEALDPIGQMQLVADEAKEQIKGYKGALANCEALRLSLQSQVDEDTKNKARLTARINRMMDDGTPDTDLQLQNYAKQLTETTKRLETNIKQLEQNTNLYNTTLKNVQAAANKIATAEQEAKNLNARLRVSESQRDLNEMFQKFDTSNLNSSLGQFERFKEIAEQKINSNNASLKVTQDLGGTSIQNIEDETNEDAKDLLASMRQNRQAPKPAAAV